MKRKSPPFETLLLKLLMPKMQKGAKAELNCASKCVFVLAFMTVIVGSYL